MSHVTAYFPFSKKVEEIITRATQEVQTYGGVIGIFIHPIVMLLLSVNFLQILSVLPLKLPLRIKSLILPFSKFVQVDSLNQILGDPLYSQEQAYSAEFRTTNQQFKDKFIYARQRGLNFLFRVVANLLMILAMRKKNI